MGTSRQRRHKGASTRDAGGFIALPWSVLDAPAFARLGYPARALLLEVARQFNGANNGRLLASRAYLATRGWNSVDVIQRARKELLTAGFLHECVKGHRPNKAGWYAVTWQALDRHPGYDAGAVETFRRGAYAGPPTVARKPVPSERTTNPKTAAKNTSLCPDAGHQTRSIGPAGGHQRSGGCPPAGPMGAPSDSSPRPFPGHLLDMPSACGFLPH